MTTMLNSDADNKSTQSFRIPLEIVREERKHDQHYHTSAPTYGGDLLLTVTYKRNLISVIIFSYRNNHNSFFFKEK